MSGWSSRIVAPHVEFGWETVEATIPRETMTRSFPIFIADIAPEKTALVKL
jgi:hypothetical protein